MSRRTNEMYDYQKAVKKMNEEKKKIKSDPKKIDLWTKKAKAAFERLKATGEIAADAMFNS